MIRKLAAALCLATAMPALAAPATGPEPLFTGRDLFDLEQATDPQISDDGRWIAYVRLSGDIMNDSFRPTIWLIDTRNGEQMPLVAGPGAHSQPRWSPDGTRLAYFSTGADGASQLYVRWMESGEAVRITNLPNTPTSLAWSPDGRQIAYTMLVPGEGETLGQLPDMPEGAEWAEPLQVYTRLAYRTDGCGYVVPGVSQVFAVSADGGAPRQLSFGEYDSDGPLSWTPDGRTILLAANRSPDWQLDANESEVYALDVAGRSLSALTNRDGPDFAPIASPDGRHIAYLGFDDLRLGYQNILLYVMDADGSNVRPLTRSLDRSIDAIEWAAGGNAIYASYVDHGVPLIARVGLDGSVRTIADDLAGGPLDRPYSATEFSVSDNGAIAATAGPATSPADIWLIDGGSRRQLTRLNDGLLDYKRLGEVRHIDTTSLGQPIEAWMTLPPNHVEGQRHPLILEIHGGPFASYGPMFSTDDQLYAAAGYVVVSANPRGSTSYGDAFANLIDRAYPGNDYDDLMAIVDAVIAEGLTDPNELFVTGGSGGGVLTSWIVGKTNRFRAAAAQKPVINWTSETLTADIAALVPRYWFSELPWENQEAYWSRSPLSLVGNVQTPTLVVVGENDYRTPASEAEQYYTALRLEGVPTALVKVPGASHGGIAARPSQSAGKAAAILAWFERWRQNPWTPPAPDMGVSPAAAVPTPEGADGPGTNH